MGSSNSIPLELQGTYLEQFKTDPIDNKSVEFSCKIVLKEKDFELTQTQTKIERKPEGGGGSINIVKMILLVGKVEQAGSNNDEITLNFNTKSASSQEGGGMMGVPLPNDTYKTDFSMKYYKSMQIDKLTKTPSGTYNCIKFVTFPKLKFDELNGVLMGKKIS